MEVDADGRKYYRLSLRSLEAYGFDPPAEHRREPFGLSPNTLGVRNAITGLHGGSYAAVGPDDTLNVAHSQVVKRDAANRSQGAARLKGVDYPDYLSILGDLARQFREKSPEMCNSAGEIVQGYVAG